jgi:hypothetical protein
MQDILEHYLASKQFIVDMPPLRHRDILTPFLSHQDMQNMLSLKIGVHHIAELTLKFVGALLQQFKAIAKDQAAFKELIERE